jgi:hypothetical protein
MREPCRSCERRTHDETPRYNLAYTVAIVVATLEIRMDAHTDPPTLTRAPRNQR